MATYAPYSTGTLSVTNGSPVVTGTGTAFSGTNASAGSSAEIILKSATKYLIRLTNNSVSTNNISIELDAYEI